MSNLPLSNSWIVRTSDFKQNPFCESVVACTSGERMTSSFKKLGMFWALAVLSVAVPVAHFVLVPAFLGIGIYAYFLQMKNTHRVVHDKFVCPACEKENELKNFFFLKDKRFRCQHCQRQLVLLHPVDSATL